MSSSGSNEQPVAPPVIEQRRAHIRRRLGRREVTSAKEQALLEATRAYIEARAEIEFEHNPDGSIKKDRSGQVVARSSGEIRDLLLRTSSSHVREAGRGWAVTVAGRHFELKGKIIGENPEYNPETAFICAQILTERKQAEVQAKQDAHAGDLEAAVQVFYDTQTESELLFDYGEGRHYSVMPVPRPTDRTHPDLRSIEAAISAYELNDKKVKQGKELVARIQKVTYTKKGGYEIPHPKSRQEIIGVLEFYEKQRGQDAKVDQFFQELDRYTDETGQEQVDPTSALEHLRRVYSKKEEQETAYDYFGRVDEHHLQRLREIQKATARFVRQRQTELLGQQQAAVRVLEDNDVSGYQDLQELAFYQEQYQAYENEWLKQMGGDRKELKRRIEQLGGLGAERHRVAEAVRAERESIDVMAQIIESLFQAQTPEEVAAMQTKLEVMQAVVKLLKQAGLKEEQIQQALGLLGPEAVVVSSMPEAQEVFKILGGGESVAHPEHPNRNEDAYFLDAEKGAAGVFDGMGGAAAGEVASAIAKTVVELSLAGIAPEASPQEIQTALVDALMEANQSILDEVVKDPSKRGMGTTASVVKIWSGPKGERKLVFANTADSRVYVHRRDGTLVQVSTDDNPLPEEVDQAVEISKLDSTQQTLFKLRNQVKNPLGSQGLQRSEINTGVFDLMEGDEVILTSDGVHDNLVRSQIMEVFDRNPGKSPAELAKLLVEQARYIAQFEAVRELGDTEIDQLFDAVGLTYSKQDFQKLGDNECAQVILDQLAKLDPQLAEIVNNPLVAKERFGQLVGQERLVNTDFAVADARLLFESNLTEIFPNIDRAKSDDITAVVLRPTVEQTVLPTGTTAPVERETGGVYLGPEQVANLFRVLAELPAFTQRRPGENWGNVRTRLEGSLQEDGDLYALLADSFGENTARLVSSRAGAHLRSGRISFIELWRIIFEQLFTNLQER